MITQKTGMPSTGSIREGIQSNQSISCGGKSSGFDVFNSTENVEKFQCSKCSPPFAKPRGAAKFCADCQAESERTASILLDNFQQHRKVVKLDRYCLACNHAKASTVMSKALPICRSCASELQSKGATARSNFIARTLNNFHKKLLREAAL